MTSDGRPHEATQLRRRAAEYRRLAGLTMVAEVAAELERLALLYETRAKNVDNRS
jgi:hypothetical protein